METNTLDNCDSTDFPDSWLKKVGYCSDCLSSCHALHYITSELTHTLFMVVWTRDRHLPKLGQSGFPPRSLKLKLRDRAVGTCWLESP